MEFNLRSRTRAGLIELINHLDQRCRKLHELNVKLEAENNKLLESAPNTAYTKCLAEIKKEIPNRYKYKVLEILEKHFA